MRLHCPGLTFSLKMQFLIFFLARSVCPVWRPTHSFWGLYPELLLLSVKSQLPFPAFILFGLFLFLLWPVLASQILPRHFCRQVINVTLLHQRIIKCQVLPWQRNAMAESQWRWGGGGCASGGIAWWKSLLGRINGSSNTRMPTPEPGRTTHTIHTLPAWQWGSPAARNECAQSDATTCGDLLMYYWEGVGDKMRKVVFALPRAYTLWFSDRN